MNFLPVIGNGWKSSVNRASWTFLLIRPSVCPTSPEFWSNQILKHKWIKKTFTRWDLYSATWNRFNLPVVGSSLAKNFSSVPWFRSTVVTRKSSFFLDTAKQLASAAESADVTNLHQFLGTTHFLNQREEIWLDDNYRPLQFFHRFPSSQYKSQTFLRSSSKSIALSSNSSPTKGPNLVNAFTNFAQTIFPVSKAVKHWRHLFHLMIWVHTFNGYEIWRKLIIARIAYDKFWVLNIFVKIAIMFWFMGLWAMLAKPGQAKLWRQSSAIYWGHMLLLSP